MRRSQTGLALVTLMSGAFITGTLGRSGLRLLAGSTAPGGDPAAAVTGLAAICAATIATWLTLCLLLAVAAQLPGATGRLARTARDCITPVVVRRWAAVALGASVSASVLPSTAVAAVRPVTAPAPVVPSPGWSAPSLTPTALPGPGFTPDPGSVPELGAPVTPVTRAAPEPGWVPRRPATKQRTDSHLILGRGRALEPEHVVVRRGDSLWSIVADRLGPGATDVEIARTWPRWYAANAGVIGDDPNLLLPGTRLRPPSAT